MQIRSKYVPKHADISNVRHIFLVEKAMSSRVLFNRLLIGGFTTRDSIHVCLVRHWLDELFDEACRRLQF